MSFMPLPTSQDGHVNNKVSQNISQNKGVVNWLRSW